MSERAVFERSRQELSLDVSVGVHILLVVEKSILESQSRGCAKTPILTVVISHDPHEQLGDRQNFPLVDLKNNLDYASNQVTNLLNNFSYKQGPKKRSRVVVVVLENL